MNSSRRNQITGVLRKTNPDQHNTINNKVLQRGTQRERHRLPKRIRTQRLSPLCSTYESSDFESPSSSSHLPLNHLFSNIPGWLSEKSLFDILKSIFLVILSGLFYWYEYRPHLGQSTMDGMYMGVWRSRSPSLLPPTFCQMRRQNIDKSGGRSRACCVFLSFPSSVRCVLHCWALGKNNGTARSGSAAGMVLMVVVGE